RTGWRVRINQDPREQLLAVGTEFAARSRPIGQDDGAPVQLIIVNPDDRRARRQIRIVWGPQGAVGTIPTLEPSCKLRQVACFVRQRYDLATVNCGRAMWAW